MMASRQSPVVRALTLMAGAVLVAVSCQQMVPDEERPLEPTNQGTIITLPWMRYEVPQPPTSTGGEDTLDRRLWPRRFGSGPDRTFAHALRLAEKQDGWTITKEIWKEDQWAFDAEVPFPFGEGSDEVHVEVSPVEEGSEVRMRSRSAGHTYDLGMNRRRVAGFLAGLDETLPPPKPTPELKVDWKPVKAPPVMEDAQASR